MKKTLLSYSKWLALGLLAGTVANAQTPTLGGTGTLQGTDPSTSVSTTVPPVASPVVVDSMSVTEYEKNKLGFAFDGDSLHPTGSVHSVCAQFIALGNPDSSRLAPPAVDPDDTASTTFETKEDLNAHSANVGLAIGFISTTYKSLSDCETALKDNKDFTDLATLADLSKVVDSRDPALGGLYDGKKIVLLKDPAQSPLYTKFAEMEKICPTCSVKKQIAKINKFIKDYPFLAPLLAPLIEKSLTDLDDKIAKAKTESEFKVLTDSLAEISKIISDLSVDKETKDALMSHLADRYTKVADGYFAVIDDSTTSAKSPADLKSTREHVSAFLTVSSGFAVDQATKDAILSSAGARFEHLKEKADALCLDNPAQAGKYMDFIAETYGVAATLTSDKDSKKKFLEQKASYTKGSAFRLTQLPPDDPEIHAFLDGGVKTLQTLASKRDKACLVVKSDRQVTQCKAAWTNYLTTQKQLDGFAKGALAAQQTQKQEQVMNDFLQRQQLIQQNGGLGNSNNNYRPFAQQNSVFGLNTSVFPNAQAYNNSLNSANIIAGNPSIASQYNANTNVTQSNLNSQYKVNTTPTVAIPLNMNFQQNTGTTSVPMESGFNFLDSTST